MTVKIIAVDMDGTFLNEDKKYNKTRFLKQYQQLQQRGIHFVVASGNQLSTLKNYFPEIAHQIAFVSENGAYVMDAEEEVSFAHFSSDLVERMRTQIAERYASSLILCGKQGAYIDYAVPEKNLEKLNKYFKSLQQLPDLTQVQDHICKVTLDTRDYDFAELCEDLQWCDFIADGSVKMVSSGFGFIDLIVPNRHKAHGLQLLQQRWKVSNDQVLARQDLIIRNFPALLQQLQTMCLVTIGNNQVNKAKTTRHHFDRTICNKVTPLQVFTEFSKIIISGI